MENSKIYGFSNDYVKFQCVKACLNSGINIFNIVFNILFKQKKPSILLGVPTLFEALITYKNVENLDFDNTRYLAEILFKLKRYDESIKQLKRALSLSHDDELLTLIGITYFKMGEYETAISIDSRNLNFYLEYISCL